MTLLPDRTDNTGADTRLAEAEVMRAVHASQRIVAMSAPQYLHLFARARTKYLDTDLIARCTPRTIEFGRKFLDLEGHTYSAGDPLRHHPIGGEREFVVVHEIMHIARGHSHRFARMAQRAKPFSLDIANYVADAIINEDIAQWRPRVGPVPSCVVRHRSLIELTLAMADAAGAAPPDIVKQPLHKTHLEQWHDLLLGLALDVIAGMPSDAANGQGTQEPSGAAGPAIGQPVTTPDTDASANTVESVRDRLIESARNAQRRFDNILNDAVSCDPPPSAQGDVAMPAPQDTSHGQAELDRQLWQRTLQQASQTPGSRPGHGIETVLLAPRLTVPWRQRLTPILSRFLTPRPGPDPLRPSRPTLVLDAEGHDAFLEPGDAPWSQGGTLVLLIDTSGSISSELLHQFAGHVHRIATTLNSPVHAIAGDTEPRSESLNLDEDARGLARLIQSQLIGRGGTAFDTMIERAEAIQADVILYLTDGFARFPPRPRTPIIWAVPPDGRDSRSFPYGHVVRID